MLMNIFIDESGIHSPVGHSTIALVYIQTTDLAKLEKQIIAAEIEAGMYGGFHWAHRNWIMRERFITAMISADFKIKLALLINPINMDASLEDALRHLIIEKHIERIFIDGNKPKSYTRRLKKILRDKNVSVKTLRTVNDQAMPAIRLADAVAGLCRYYHDQPDSRAKPLYKLLKPKITVTLEL